MTKMVSAATLSAPFELRVESYPYPTELEPGSVTASSSTKNPEP